MDNLERELYRLPKAEPSTTFCDKARHRLMSKISLEYNESWFRRFLKRVSPVNPSSHFVQMARLRLFSQMEQVSRPIASWMIIVKRTVASTLVMVLAVTTTLFFVEGGQQVAARHRVVSYNVKMSKTLQSSVRLYHQEVHAVFPMREIG